MAEMTKRTVPTFNAWPQRPESLYQDLRIAAVGHLHRKTTRIRARFDHVAVGLVVAGQGNYSAGRGGEIAIVPGTLFGVYPGTVFDYGPTAWWEEYYLGFAGPGVRRLLQSGLIPKDGRPRQVADVRQAVRGFEQVMRLWQRGRPGDGDRACLRGLAILIDLFSNPLLLVQSKKVDPIEAVLALCRRCPEKAINFRHQADRYGVSYSTLRQQIRRQTGSPPAQYLARLRCQAACVQLATTVKPVKHIARAIGIPDQYSFSRTFRRVIGLSPQRYRQLHRAYG